MANPASGLIRALLKGGAILLILNFFNIKLPQPLSRLPKSHYCFQLSVCRSLIKWAVQFWEPDDLASSLYCGSAVPTTVFAPQ